MSIRPSFGAKKHLLAEKNFEVIKNRSKSGSENTMFRLFTQKSKNEIRNDRRKNEKIKLEAVYGL